MADAVDLLDGYQDRIVQESLATMERVRHPRGVCLYCGDTTAGVFCSPEETDCRDSWEHEQRLRKQNGR